MKFSSLAGSILLLPGITFAQSVIQPFRFPTMEVAPAAATIREPGAVSSLSGDDLKLRSIERLEDLQSRTPNLIAKSGGTRSLNHVFGFRGLVNNPFYGEPAISIYVDDVPYGPAFTYDTSFLEVGRVEIMRGPQFTRWGRQGAAGLISMDSRPPGDRIGVRAEAGFATHDEQYYKLAIDGPLGPKLTFSLNGMYSRRDGYLYNDFLKYRPDYQEGFVGRFSMQWQVTDRLQVQLTAGAQHYDDGTQRFTTLDANPRVVEHDFVGVTRGRSNVESLRIRYTGEEVKFTSVTARRSFRLDPASFDLDFSPLPILPSSVVAEHLFYTQEFRLQSAQEGPWEWIVGAFGSWANLDLTVDDNVYVGDSELNDQALALFGEITRKFDNHVDVTVGLRGDIVKKTAERTLLRPDGTVTHEDLSRTISNLSPKLALNWHPTESFLVYGSSSLSYRPGGYSLFNFNPQIESSATERNWANEVGAKTSLLDGKLEIALAAFWYEIRDYLVERYLLAGFGVHAAKEVTSRGIELEILSRPIRGLELSAAVGYVDAQFKKHENTATGESYVGRTPPYVPNVTANFAAQYRHDSGWMARVEWLLTGRTFFDESNSATGEQNAYGILNARVGFEQKNWAIYIYGKNLTDSEYYSLKIPSLSIGALGEPRSVGVMVTMSL